MFSQAIRRWLAPTRPIRRPEARRFHPGLEMLEGRAVPAAFVVAGADAGGPPLVGVLTDSDVNGTYETRVLTFRAFGGSFTGGVRVATGDFDGDGNDELIAATGRGAGMVKIFDLAPDGTVTLLEAFKPFGARFRGGVFVAAGDLNGDGRDELVMGAGRGLAQVKIFSDTDRDGVVSDNQTDSFLAYPGSFRGGVRVTLGDMDAVGRAPLRDELITGPGPGSAQPVKIWHDADLVSSGAVSDDPLFDEFFPFEPGFTGGVFVAASSQGLARTGGNDLVVGRGRGAPEVKIFVDTDTPGDVGSGQVSDDPLFESFLAYPRSFTGGMRVALGDTSPGGVDDRDELLTGSGPGRSLPVRIFQDNADVGSRLGDNPRADSFAPFGPGFSRGVFVAFGKVTAGNFASTHPPQGIVFTTNSSIFVPQSAGVVRDLNVALNISHTFVEDLEVMLTHFNSDGTQTMVSLFSKVGGLANGFIIHLDDDAGADIGTVPMFEEITITGTYQPEGPAALSVFNRVDASGEWRLTIHDDYPFTDSGTLFGWSLLISY